jgi:hypothetical protein
VLVSDSNSAKSKAISTESLNSEKLKGLNRNSVTPEAIAWLQYDSDRFPVFRINGISEI